MSTGFKEYALSCSQEDGWGNPRESGTFQTPIEKNRVQVFCCRLPVSKFPDLRFTSKLFFFFQFYVNSIKKLHLKVNLQLDINISALHFFERIIYIHFPNINHSKSETDFKFVKFICMDI